MSGEVILFEFDKSEDLEDALDWCPWVIQGNCLSLKRWKLGMRIADVQFHILQFWVQIHGLEVEKFSKQNAERIGESLGNVLEVDDILGLMGLDRDFVRIKVEVDIWKPLQAGFWYRRRNREMVWAKSKYERFPEYCFGCGKLGHVERLYNSEITVSEEENGGPMYGRWIRADSHRRRREQCRYVGTKQWDSIGENKRRSWKDLMKEKEVRGEKVVPQRK